MLVSFFEKFPVKLTFPVENMVSLVSYRPPRTGGWEYDESMEEAATRETLEEAGVVGNIECKLGKWSYESKRRSTLHEGHMFPMLVKQELNFWPEKNIRTREWVTISKAKEECPHLWMREALEELVSRQQPRAKEEEADRTTSK
ncbi:hypothetical protein V6N12_043196 [Hibiscus sabdariffa]|uniref:Nudix hydrolase domain-containing protein n=1 Tax=Hibiscus sabdariffa TaxID=183260 RepID=A0ABR2DDP0_9ROSI